MISKTYKFCKPLPSLEYIKDKFVYHKGGFLVNKKDVLEVEEGTGVIVPKLGKKLTPVGCYNSQGYRVVSIDNRKCFEHRLIWKYHTGQDPIGELDHINRNPKDNRIENLRECTSFENHQNGPSVKERMFKGATSKYIGVSFNNRSGLFRANVRVNGKQISLGYYADEEAAAAARNRYVLEHFGEFAPINLPKESHAAQELLFLKELVQKVGGRSEAVKIICRATGEGIKPGDMRSWLCGKKIAPKWVAYVLTKEMQ